MNLFDVLEQVPGEIAWKDNHFRYLGCNANRAKKINLKRAEHIVGLCDKDLCDQSSESIAFHHQHDQLALKGEAIKTIHPSAIKSDGISYFQVKKPLIINGQIAGVIYHCNEFVKPDFFHHLNKRDKKHFPDFCLAYYEIEPQQNFYKLTVRELECLFCLLRGLSANETGKLMALSKRTVEFYIENIKNKLGCQTKSALIIKAIEANYIQLIPARFLNVDWKNL